FRAHYVEQTELNGTAGAVKLAQPFIDEDLLIIFVDTLFDADLGLVRREGPEVAGIIWAKEVEDYQRYGVIVADEQRFMQRIIEKPKEPVSKLANIGLYYIRDWRLFFRGVDHTLAAPPGPGGGYHSPDAFQYMIDNGAKIRTAEVAGWYDCGQVGTLLETNRHLLETSRGREPEGGTNVRVHPPVRVEPGAVLEDVELGPNVTVGAGTTLRRCAVRDAIIGAQATIEDARLHDSLIGDRVVIQGVSGSVSVCDDSEVRA